MTRPRDYQAGDGYFEHDPADPDSEHRHRFGYEHMVVTRRAREWFRVAHPEWGEGLMFDQQVSFIVERWQRTLPTYAEISRRREVRRTAEGAAAWLSGESSRDPGLTKPELEFLADHFEGANDPTAQAILAKVRAVLA